MAVEVIKLGGSNFRSLNDYSQVQQVLKHYQHPVAVVVSAYYGITDRLQALTTTPDRAATDSLMDYLHQHTKQLENLYGNGENTGFQAGRRAISQLERLLKSSRLQESPYQQTLALSYGERINALWLVAALQARGVAAVYSPPENIGLRCTGGPRFASIDFEGSSLHAAHFAHEAVYVIPGFYAVDSRQRVCLLGRGGSDYAAAAVAALAGARALDLWKDVNGFYTAHPQFVNHTQTIRHLNYAEAAELAYFGSELLHPRSTEPLQPRGIPIRLFNIRRPDLKEPGTFIGPAREQSHETIKSITHSTSFAILELQGSGVGMLPGLLAQVTGKLQEADINIKSVITAQTDINVLLDADDAEQAASLVQALEIPGILHIRLQTDIAVLATVGEGLAATYGIAARVLQALAGQYINIRLMAIGASKVAGYFVISKKELEKAVKAVHNALFQVKQNVEW